MRKDVNGVRVELIQGDLTEERTDAIVNAANSQLILGGGVAGAIRTKGGPSIQEECNRIGDTPVGSAAITGAGDLHAKYVIHAVGPRMGEGDEGNKLESCAKRSLELADEKELKSVSFPAISTGIFGVPPKIAAPAMMRGIKKHVESGTGLKTIRIVLFSDRLWADFSSAMSEILQEE